MRSRPVTVALLGPFGGGNLGDAAIQDAVLAHLGARRPDVRMIGISMVPADTMERHGIETYAYNTHAFQFNRRKARREPARESPTFARRIRESLRWRLSPLLRAAYGLAHALYVFAKLTKIDLLLVSGGGQIDEFWGGPWEHPFTLFKWVTLARLTGTRVAFLSVGAGTVSSSVSRWFLRRALRQAHYRSFRDAGSKQIVGARLGCGADDPVVPDMAFALPVAPLVNSAGDPKKRVLVAIGPMPYGHPEIWPERDSGAYERYIALLAEFSRKLMQEGITPEFFPGQISSDPAAIQDICDRLDARPTRPSIRTVGELMSFLSTADIVVASRFHGALLALLLRRPVIALSYERKVRQLMADCGQADLCLDLEHASFDQLLRTYASAMSRRHAISAVLDARVRRDTSAVLAQFDLVASSLLPKPRLVGRKAEDLV